MTQDENRDLDLEMEDQLEEDEDYEDEDDWDDDDYEDDEREPVTPWAVADGEEAVTIETGRGTSCRVAVGAPFEETIVAVAEQANYGKFFRVFLNGHEIVSPDDAPETIESDMRIVLTTYDKVG